VSLRRFEPPAERGGVGGVEVFTDSEVVSGADGAAGGWLVATGLREAHPESVLSTETTRMMRSANLKEPIPRVIREAGSIRELDVWPDCGRGVAPFTGGP
jgi:hypothetical protein